MDVDEVDDAVDEVDAAAVAGTFLYTLRFPRVNSMHTMGPTLFSIEVAAVLLLLPPVADDIDAVFIIPLLFVVVLCCDCVFRCLEEAVCLLRVPSLP